MHKANKMAFQFVIYVCCLFVLFPLLSSSHQVPALYVFGDSTVDPGNNKIITHKSKANFLPFGLDFKDESSGRFTNGKTIADFLAIKLGLPLVPPYLGLSEDQRKNITTGINYGSASSGVLASTNNNGSQLSLVKQIDYFAKTLSEDLSKNPQELHLYLSDSIFLLSIGTNDYGRNFLDPSAPKSLFIPLSQTEFADLVLEELSVQIKRLVSMGAKRILINNLGPLGCIPMYTFNTGICSWPINHIVRHFSEGLPKMLSRLKGQLTDPIFSYSDNVKFFAEMKLDKNIDTDHKCANSKISVCENRDAYFFFDGVHTTEIANSKLIDGCFHRDLCTPNIEQLISLERQEPSDLISNRSSTIQHFSLSSLCIFYLFFLVLSNWR